MINLLVNRFLIDIGIKTFKHIYIFKWLWIFSGLRNKCMCILKVFSHTLLLTH